MISADGIRMAEDKITEILKWEVPKTVKDVQRFLGFANFYRRFIQDFSKVCKPLTDLTKKGKTSEWPESAQGAFELLKQRFTTAPVLRHFDPTLQTVVETDASNFAIGAILSQQYLKRLHPVAFHSRKMDKAEINYEIHDKEMLAIVSAFKECRRYLEGAQHEVLVFIDYKNLEYFTTTKVLNRRQARWAQELAGYEFKSIYSPGAQNGKPDALSRRSEYRPAVTGQGETEDSENQPISRILSPDQLVSQADYELEDSTPRVIVSSAMLQKLPRVKFHQNLLNEVSTAGSRDPKWEEIKCQLEGKVKTYKEYEWDSTSNSLYYKDRLYVPDNKELRRSIVEKEHDSVVAGHMGADKTIELV